MIDRPQGGERTILVQIGPQNLETDLALAEFKELAMSAGADILGIVTGTRSKPDAKYYVGLGKTEEILEHVKEHAAELVLVNHDLSPSQERNLERLFECRVIGRSGLILDIFAQRALTFEGKLQVELAQLQHLSTRLIRGWTHLERQKGGIGLRGPGETQLETDRRLLRERIKAINKRLEKVQLTRSENRRARQKAAVATVSLVGYTNAGKSSLFNILTGADIYVADQLFATLDPTMRKMALPGSPPIILADTVGFIRDLPHHLVAAFQATLEETKEADLLLHVIDISDPNWRDTVSEVKKVLDQIGIGEVKVLQVFNKIDTCEAWKALLEEELDPIGISAKTGEGLDDLCLAIAEELHGSIVDEEIILSAKYAKLRARLYEQDAVLSESITDKGEWQMHIQLPRAEKDRLFIACDHP